MTYHIDDLLARVQKRVPKLIDQMALQDIREQLAAQRDADDHVCEQLPVVCSECQESLIIENDGERILADICTCQDAAIDAAHLEQTKGLFQKLAGMTNDPEMLTVIGKGLGK
jgi:hypothetical protein